MSADSESEARRRMRPSTITSLGDGALGFRKGGVRSQRSLSQQQASQGGVMCSLVRHLSGRPAEAAETRGPVARAPGFLFPGRSAAPVGGAERGVAHGGESEHRAWRGRRQCRRRCFGRFAMSAERCESGGGGFAGVGWLTRGRRAARRARERHGGGTWAAAGASCQFCYDRR